MVAERLKMKLYEIAAAYLAPLKELESSDATPEIIADTLADIKDDFAEKARNVARYVKQLSGEQAVINDEIARLQKRAAQLERKEGALRKYLLYWMAETGTAEINDPVLPIAIKRNPEKLEIPVLRNIINSFLIL